jgi:hypothetical protein
MKPRVKTPPISQSEFAVIDAIVHRALVFFPDREERDVKMDLVATHLAVPLRLNDLLDSPDEHFVHDIVGIERHLDRQLFVLRHCFRPRYAAPKEQTR